MSTAGTTRYSNPLVFEVDISHLCWFCELTERNPDAHIISRLLFVKGEYVICILELTSPTVKKDIDFIRNHKLVKKVEIIMLGPNTAILKTVSKYEALTMKILNRSGVTLLESPVTRGGMDSELLLAKSHKQMADLLSRWREQKDYYDVKLKRKKYLKPDTSFDLFRKSGFLDLESAKEMLTGKQLEIFRLACNYGYYETPKKITLAELADRTGIAPSTLAEHLRKAEAKLLPILLKLMQKT
jgi:predicted DNA binding protein